MRQFSMSGVEGHLNGGPLRFRRRTPHGVLSLTAFVTAACAAHTGGPAAPGRSETLARPLEIYRDLGFITGNAQFPAVAELSTLAGPADSTFVLLALSLPNSALRFQRDDAAFVAEYRIDVALLAEDSSIVRRFSARETVRVSTFAETGRTEESIVFQQAVAVPPGRYIVRVEASDAHSVRGFRAFDTITAPDYRGASIATPILVHEALGRTARDSLPRIIVNPRRTMPYGGAAPRIYLEAYDTVDQPLLVRVIGERGDTVWRSWQNLERSAETLRFAIVEVPAELLPLGRFSVEVETLGVAPLRTPLVMTISDQWMVASLEDVLQLLRFIAHDVEIDSLRVGSPAQQRAAWDRFWTRRDPLPITGINEYRDQFFQRVRYAADAFRESGRPGWASHRGEVYIVLGPPDHTIERLVGAADVIGRYNAEEWIYVNAPSGRVSLLFHDRTGFGRLELVPSSAAAFRGIADGLKARAGS